MAPVSLVRTPDQLDKATTAAQPAGVEELFVSGAAPLAAELELACGERLGAARSRATEDRDQPDRDGWLV